MRISVVACDLPHRDGTAAGRDLLSWCEGMRELGHDLHAWVWSVSPSSPRGPVPAWCRDISAPATGRLRTGIQVRRLLGDAGFDPLWADVVVADHVPSFAAVSDLPNAVATMHLRTVADVWASRRLHRSDIEAALRERSVSRSARLVLAYSDRVARRCRVPFRIVPISYPLPQHAVAPVEEPVAAIIADWWWPPNKIALARLLAAWPAVRDRVKGARLLVAGRHLDDLGIGVLAGVVQLGEVGSSIDVLSRAAVLAFPCPSSSGPKVKVLEAMAYGVPAVTTAAGMEGISVDPGAGAVVTTRGRFGEDLARVLGDPEQRAALGTSGRACIEANHSGRASALARIEAMKCLCDTVDLSERRARERLR